MNVTRQGLPALLLTAALVCSMTPAAGSAQAMVQEKMQAKTLANTQGLAQETAQAVKGERKDPDCLSPKMVQLKSDMQKAWIDHTIWTRSYIVSALSDRADQKDVLDRLLQNQQDIGNLIKPYYGEAAGNKLAELLKEHIVIAGKIVAAAKAGNQADVKKLDADWHRNADDIAKFLSTANPNWQFKTLQDMLYEHLQLITDLVMYCLKGDWKSDIAVTDKNEIHMIHLADILTEGIIKQFPDKF